MDENIKHSIGIFIASAVFFIIGANTGTPGTKSGVASVCFMFIGIVGFFCGAGFAISTIADKIRKK